MRTEIKSIQSKTVKVKKPKAETPFEQQLPRVHKLLLHT